MRGLMRGGMIRGLVFGGIVMAVLILGAGRVLAQENFEGQMAGQEVPMDIQDEMENLQQFLDQELGGQERVSFGDLMAAVARGDLTQVLEQAGRLLYSSLVQEVQAGARLLVQVGVIGLAGAVFTAFSSIFKSRQISDTGFFVTYLLLFVCLAASFLSSLSIAAGALDQILGFMQALMPAFFLAAAFSGGSASAIVLYEAMIGAVGVVQWLCRSLLLPGVRVFVVLSMVSHVAREDMLSRLAGLLERAIEWSLKTMVGVILGFHLIQGMVLPFADSAGQAGIRKLIELIPGIGRGAGTAAQLILGSGTVIKNSIGAAAVVVLGLMSLIPLVKLILLLALCQGAAAVMEPVCDKRIVRCVEGAAAGHRLLVKIVVCALVLFALAIALVCFATNVNYYSI